MLEQAKEFETLGMASDIVSQMREEADVGMRNVLSMTHEE
jgi:hypothetical protein